MPTGYTAIIADGVDFQTFVMKCARAMGALITMRDDPDSAKIPEKFEPSDYHPKEIKKAQAMLAQLSKMSLKQSQHAAQKSYEDELTRRQLRISEDGILRQKYNEMLNKVRAWQPPSPDHIEFKKFMIGQIEGSIKQDCSLLAYYRSQPIPLLTAQEWLKKEQDQALRDLEYHIRASSRTWVQQLRKSLEDYSPAITPPPKT